VNTLFIGYRDQWGNTLKRHRGAVTLWETPKGYYGVYLSVSTQGYELHGLRKYRQDADALFDEACLMLQNLLPEQS